MNNKRVLGIISIVLGIVLIINSQTTILGAVIGFKEISTNASLIVGLVFVIFGIALFFAIRRHGEIKRSKRFLKDIKKLKPGELGKVEEAIRKIGTGQGKEEKLRLLSGYSIRVDKQSRVRFDYESNGDINLTDYDREHLYK